MSDFVKKFNTEKYTEVLLNIEHSMLMSIGEKMQEIDENAYMNGYNWEAFLNCYLAEYAPDVLQDMKTDPEAGMYVAYYDLTPENEAKAAKLTEIICDLVANEDKLYDFLRQNGAKIAWD